MPKNVRDPGFADRPTPPLIAQPKITTILLELIGLIVWHMQPLKDIIGNPYGASTGNSFVYPKWARWVDV